MSRITINRIALTMAQVEEHQPPPNPAKLTDTRANEYIALYGEDSWELDALDPATLAGLIEDAITAEWDEGLYNQRETEEENQRSVLMNASHRWPDIVRFLSA